MSMVDDFVLYFHSVVGRATRTCSEYKKEILFFANWLSSSADLTADETLYLATKHDVQEYIADCTNANNSESTRARKISCLRTFYGYLCSEGIIEHNPLEGMPRPHVHRKLPVYLALEDAKKLINTSRSEKDVFYRRRNSFIVILFLNSGIRLSEMAGICMSDIYDDSILIRGKGSKERYVFLNKSTRDSLQLWLGIRGAAPGHLLVSKSHTDMAAPSIYAIVKRELKEAGLDAERLSPHKLRHTCATLMYRYGNVDIRLLQSVLGHSSIATTEIYTHVVDSQIIEAMNQNPLANY